MTSRNQTKLLSFVPFVDLDALRLKANELSGQSMDVPSPYGARLMEECLTLGNLLEDFSLNTEIRDDYFRIIKGGFESVLESLKKILPHIEDTALKGLTSTIISGVQTITDSLDEEMSKMRAAIDTGL